VSRAVVSFFFVGGFAAFASRGHFLPVQAVAAPNVLLVTIDTLRADHLGSYGYATAKTPVMDELSASGVRFADATAHAPLTYPSHAAILTGRYPGSFGIRLNGMNPLPPSAVTLAERMKSAGYRTGAIVASVLVDRSSGLAQGFDEYDDRIAVQSPGTIALSDLQRPAAEITTLATSWIERQQEAANRTAPWFLWVHYYDPHLPYDAPAKFAALTPGRPYDAEIAYVDAELGRLLGAIDRTRTAVVVTSDHGEALGDHGEPDHGFFLYDATLRVPLVVAAPGFAPRVVTEQVRHLDIVPTIVALAGSALAGAGSQSPKGDDEGESLVPLLRGQTRREIPVSLAESWYPRLHFGWSELRSARVGEWKYIAAPRPELYDLRVDRAETRNVAGDRASVAARLAADMARIAARFTQPEATTADARIAQPDAATIERLRALGYVGTFAPVTAGTAAGNPADHIADYRQYRDLFNRALGALGRGRAADAALLLQRLVKLNVRAFEAHLYLGNAYAAQKRFDPALGEYDVASQLNPSSATPHFEAGKVLSSKGEPAEAAARVRRGLELEPQSYYGYYTLGVIHQRAERWAEAADAFTRAIALNDRDPRAHANLAGAAMRLGNVDLARGQSERMIALGYQVAPAQFNLGVIAARRGDRAEAERRYRLALEADPKFTPAIDALAKLGR
jgi:arylsulfatase A-like enzyme/Tfp pilus assembly protein PilF